MFIHEKSHIRQACIDPLSKDLQIMAKLLDIPHPHPEILRSVSELHVFGCFYVNDFLTGEIITSIDKEAFV